MLFSIPTGSTVGSMLTAVLMVVIVMIATAAWVYRDSSAWARHGRPVVSSVGPFQIKKPVAWFVACLLLWELAFPLYINSRSAA